MIGSKNNAIGSHSLHANNEAINEALIVQFNEYGLTLIRDCLLIQQY